MFYFKLLLWAGLLFGATTALTLEDFTGGRPLNAERIVTDLLEYYKQEDPMGIPVLEVPDTLFIDKNVSLSLFNIHGLTISGQSGVRLEYVKINATDLTAQVLIRIPRLEILSVYDYSGYFTSSVGDMNLTFIELDITTEGQLGADHNGVLALETLEVTVEKEDFIPEFTEPPAALSLVVNAADTFFDTIVNLVLGNSVDDVKRTVNVQLAERLAPRRFPIGIHPVDLFLATVKRDMKAHFDPLNLGNVTKHLLGGITLMAENIVVRGLSTLHRTHEVSIQFIDDRLLAVLQIGTKQVSVSSDVELSVSLLPSVTNSLNFTLEDFSVWVEVQQAADIRHPPQLRRIHFDLGNFALSTSGDNTLSYVLEATVNIVPNLLRNVIVDRLEPYLQQVIQRRMNTLDLEALVEDNLEKLQ